MDAKDLRAESALSDRGNDGRNKYTENNDIHQYDKNKHYHDIGSNALGKVDVPTSRPCAVIGPDRVVPQQDNNAYLKKDKCEAWPPLSSTGYSCPPEYSPKISDFENHATNISPRLTYQENMPRVMVQPRYNSVKLHESTNYPVEMNVQSKNLKLNDSKNSEVPYVNNINIDHKLSRTTEVCVSNVNPGSHQSAPWPFSNINSHPHAPYDSSETYSYPDYPPGPKPIPRSVRAINEDQHVYTDPYYHPGNIRYRPYPTIRERFPPPPRCEYNNITQYSNPYHPASFAVHNKIDMQKSVPNPYTGYAQAHPRYRESRLLDPVIDCYQRPITQQVAYNTHLRHQVVRNPYATMPSNCIQSKLPPYNSESRNFSRDKPPTDQNKIYIEYEGATAKNYLPDNCYPHEMAIPGLGKNQMPLNYPPGSLNMMHPYPYYKKNLKPYDQYPLLRNVDLSLHPHQFPRIQTHFAPKATAVSPSDSTISNDTTVALGNIQEDYGYVSQSSTTSGKSMDSYNRLQSETYPRYDYQYNSIIQNLPSMSKTVLNTNQQDPKYKKDINVRQFLQMWNDGDDENNDSNKEISVLSAPVESTKHLENNQEQLVVLGLVNVSNEDLSKYDHIQKVTKLPENIKGYNSIELLNQFEEAIESSNINMLPKIDVQTHLAKPNSKQRIEVKSRPISPLDVEAKISQSVIHKEVGCNFEIKPCSPQMLSAEIATPIQTVSSERLIEKFANPLLLKSPRSFLNPNDNIETNNLKLSNIKIASCNMANSQNSVHDPMNSLKTNYTIQDLESNSGVCLASLPRLDNDIELNFPEVNQQFINANKINHVSKETILSNDASFVDISTYKPGACSTRVRQCYSPNVNETGFTKLSKFRKQKNHNDCKENETEPVIRKDSVIIKNPENKNFEQKGTKSPKCIGDIEDYTQDPINLSTQLHESIKIPDDKKSKSPNTLTSITLDKEINSLDSLLLPVDNSTVMSHSPTNSSLSTPLIKNSLNLVNSVYNDISDCISMSDVTIDDDLNSNNKNGIVSVSDNNTMSSRQTDMQTKEHTEILDSEDKFNQPAEIGDIHIVNAQNSDSSLSESQLEKCGKILEHTKMFFESNNYNTGNDDLNKLSVDYDPIENDKSSLIVFPVDCQNNDVTINTNINVSDSNKSQRNNRLKCIGKLKNFKCTSDEKNVCFRKRIFCSWIQKLLGIELFDNNLIDPSFSHYAITLAPNNTEPTTEFDDHKSSEIEDNINQNGITTLDGSYAKNHVELNINSDIPVKSDVSQTKPITENEKSLLVCLDTGDSDSSRKTLEIDSIKSLNLPHDEKSTNIKSEEVHVEVTEILNREINIKSPLNSESEINNDYSFCEISKNINIETDCAKDDSITDRNIISVDTDTEYINGNIETSEHNDNNKTNAFPSTETENIKNKIEKRICENEKRIHEKYVFSNNEHKNDLSEDINTQILIKPKNVTVEQSETITCNTCLSPVCINNCELISSEVVRIDTINSFLTSEAEISEQNTTVNTIYCGTEATEFNINLENLKNNIPSKSQPTNSNVESILVNHISHNVKASSTLKCTDTLFSDGIDICEPETEINIKISENSKNATNDNAKPPCDHKDFSHNSLFPDLEVRSAQPNTLYDSTENDQSVEKHFHLKSDMKEDKHTEANISFAESNSINADISSSETGLKDSVIQNKNQGTDETSESDIKNVIDLNIFHEKTVKSLKELVSAVVASMQSKTDIDDNINMLSHINKTFGGQLNTAKKHHVRDSKTTRNRSSSLKRSLSDSAIDLYETNFNQSCQDDVSRSWARKRKKTSINNEILENQFLSENLCNIIQNSRRNSIATIYNEDVSFCILIENDCIITEENEDSNNYEVNPNIVEFADSINTGHSDAYEETTCADTYDLECNEDKSVTESWVEDVACMETVVTDDIAEDVIISTESSPKNNFSELEINNDSTENIFLNGTVNLHTDKVKLIYGQNMCNDDAEFVEKLYRTPQMDVNKTLIDKEFQDIEEIGCYDKESLVKMLSEPNDPSNKDCSVDSISASNDILTNNLTYYCSDNILKDSGYDADRNSSVTNSKQNDKSGSSGSKNVNNNVRNDNSLSICEKIFQPNNSCLENVPVEDKLLNSSDIRSSSPEVSSTTSEEKNSGILLKITSYKGSRISQITEASVSTDKKIRCKLTEDKDFLHYDQNIGHRLLTKAAKKYIPPLKESIPHLKVKLPLPHDSLQKLKELKIAKSVQKLENKTIINSVSIHSKKIKPKFEDVLKSIDEIQIKMHKEKNKKPKKVIPKVVIKKSENGSHYASSSDTFNPDLTGRKWQPWVFIEKNGFVDKMAVKNKTTAIYSHRKKDYVLSEKFYKYKSFSSAKFIISHPKLDNLSKGHLKYTIKLKHTY